MPETETALAQRLMSGDRRALARAISLVEDDDPEGWALVREVYPHTGKSTIVGFTGPPGVGKSTLLAALTKLERGRDRTIGVLSIDPSSPFTKGALLGDRIRLADHFLDPGVFIRSMASRGALGGLSEAALQTALLMDASGRDVILLETVGVGQAEVDIIELYDPTVNNERATARMVPVLERAADGDAILNERSGAAEDVSVMLAEVPGLYFNLGIVPRNQDLAKAAPNHSPDFFLDESALVISVRAMAMVTINYLATAKAE